MRLWLRNELWLEDKIMIFYFFFLCFLLVLKYSNTVLFTLFGQ